MKPICFFRQFGYTDCLARADGQLDRAHLIPAQRLRIAGVSGVSDIWDHRAWTWACRRHHDRFDGRDALNKIDLTREQLPDGIEDYAAEHGLSWSLDRDYGLPDASPVAETDDG